MLATIISMGIPFLFLVFCIFYEWTGFVDKLIGTFMFAVILGVITAGLILMGNILLSSLVAAIILFVVLKANIIARRYRTLRLVDTLEEDGHITEGEVRGVYKEFSTLNYLFWPFELIHDAVSSVKNPLSFSHRTEKIQNQLASRKPL